jgi:histone deacetylase 6
MAHTPEHVDATLGLCGVCQEEEGAKAELQTAILKRSMTQNFVYMNETSVDCALLAAGACIAAVDAVCDEQSEIENAVAVVRPPGHHAECGCGMGFCIFSNVALAAAHSVNTIGLKRVLVVDWDVHHGNGTQEIFLDDPRVLVFSAHRYDWGIFYPGSYYQAIGKDSWCAERGGER